MITTSHNFDTLAFNLRPTLNTTSSHFRLNTVMSGRGRGRGWYYKEKYGGGGRGGSGGAGGGGAGRGREHSNTYHPYQQTYQDIPQRDNAPHDTRGNYSDEDNDGSGADFTRPARTNARNAPSSATDLEHTLRRIDGKGYKAYHDIYGSWVFPTFTLHVDKIQGDPYASPSRCRVTVPCHVANFPAALLSSPIRRTALCDYLTRSFGAAVRSSGGDVRADGGGWHGEKGGDMAVDAPGQHVLQRTSIIIHSDGSVEARFTVGLPARGRSVLGDWAAAVLVRNLPRYVDAGLQYQRQDKAAVARHVECVEDTDALRRMLPSIGLVAFVGDGSILPRKSGASDEPMLLREAVPFASPPSLAVELSLPNRGRIRGMGIRKGVTLICGGGFHGKSTLLEALENGVYDKIPGDGRELIATDPSAVKIRAEDGRRVAVVDISPYISNLPMGRDTKCFSSADASGSTSQAANIQEALEVGSTTLLIDEDTSATNFMVRDARMRELVAAEKEPITPFVARIRALSASGVSCVLVIGGTGEYFSEADCVLALDSYKVEEVTARAHEIAAKYAVPGSSTDNTPIGTTNGTLTMNSTAKSQQQYPAVVPRTLVSLVPGDAAPTGAGGRKSPHRELRTKTRGKHEIVLDDQELDLCVVEQLVEVSQTRAVGDALLWLRMAAAGGALRGASLAQMLDRLEKEMDSGGVDVLSNGSKVGNLARPRRFEIAAAVNRLRSAEMEQIRC